MKKLNFSRKVVSTILIYFFFASYAVASTVDTVLTYSPSMKKSIKAVIIKPDNYSKKQSFPVVYLLHGAGGNCTDWIKKVPGIVRYADDYNMIIVCPDGEKSSWYFDSPVDSTFKYETYISGELVKWIDEHYKTVKGSTGRAITGLSMGGHGALYLAFKHQNIYGAAGSMSGGVDLRPFPNNWDISKRLGKYSDYPERWGEHSVIDLTYLLAPGSLSLIIDCGVADFFYPVNQKLHEKLLFMNIAHDFIARPGEHSWNYWANAIQYQMLFMNSFFKKAN